MEINRELVMRVARLANLSLGEDEAADMACQMGRIAADMEVLSRLEGDGEDAAPAENTLRPDEVGPSLPRERLLDNAPQTEEGLFAVPKAVE